MTHEEQAQRIAELEDSVETVRELRTFDAEKIANLETRNADLEAKVKETQAASTQRNMRIAELERQNATLEAEDQASRNLIASLRIKNAALDRDVWAGEMLVDQLRGAALDALKGSEL